MLRRKAAHVLAISFVGVKKVGGAGGRDGRAKGGPNEDPRSEVARGTETFEVGIRRNRRSLSREHLRAKVLSGLLAAAGTPSKAKTAARRDSHEDRHSGRCEVRDDAFRRTQVLHNAIRVERGRFRTSRHAAQPSLTALLRVIGTRNVRAGLVHPRQAHFYPLPATATGASRTPGRSASDGGTWMEALPWWHHHGLEGAQPLSRKDLRSRVLEGLVAAAGTPSKAKTAALEEATRHTSSQEDNSTAESALSRRVHMVRAGLEPPMGSMAELDTPQQMIQNEGRDSLPTLARSVHKSIFNKVTGFYCGDFHGRQYKRNRRSGR